MTAQELDTMVNQIRSGFTKNINYRSELNNIIFDLWRGLNAINRTELASQLAELYTEIDSVSTKEIIKMGTFGRY